MTDTPAAAVPTAIPDGVEMYVPPPPDGLAVPFDFDARYADGLRTGLSLGGGGIFFVAWQVAYLHTMAREGIDLAGADRVVGTSAGSVVASVLEGGNIGRLFREVSMLAKVPKLVGALAPAGNLHSSQLRARDLFALAADNDPDTIEAIGHAALAAQTPPASVMSRNIGVILATRKWPSHDLYLTCVDAYTGERCVVTRRAGVPIARTVAASSAVPGLFAPQPILDRRCMDGGVSGSGIHLDLLAGSKRVVVLALTDGEGVDVGLMTSRPGSIHDEVAALEASGSEVFFRKPETVEIEKLMDPSSVPQAIEMGRRQATADAADLRTFLA